MYQGLALLSLSLLLVGCATVGRSYQTVYVNSHPQGAEIYYHGNNVGTTPALVKIPRNTADSVELRTNVETKSVALEGHYRWLRSFCGNMLFSIFAPVGWIVDGANGTAYSYPDRLDVELKKFPPPAHDSTVIENIAVAPPHSPHPNISDEIGPHLVSTLQTSLGAKYKVLDYSSTLEMFHTEDVDYDSPVDPHHAQELYGRLGVRKIFASSVDLSGQRVTVDGEVQDFFTPTKNKKFEYNFNPDNFLSVNEVGWMGHTSRVFYFLPNTVGLEFGKADTSLDIGQSNIEAKSSPTAGWQGQALQYVSAIAIRRVEPPSTRPTWSYHFNLSPTANFSYNREEFPTFVNIKDQEFTRLHADLGYGPNFNYGSAHWNFYFSIDPILGYDKISTNANGVNIESSDTHITLAGEFGLYYFFTSHWHLRAFSRSASVPTKVWKDVLEKSTGQTLDVSNANLLTTGISVGYILPNQFFK